MIWSVKAPNKSAFFPNLNCLLFANTSGNSRGSQLKKFPISPPLQLAFNNSSQNIRLFFFKILTADGCLFKLPDLVSKRYSLFSEIFSQNDVILDINTSFTNCSYWLVPKFFRLKMQAATSSGGILRS